MGKVWVLDTETKGTGAQMMPLERVLEKRTSGAVPSFGFRTPRAPAPAATEPRQPLRFKIVDVMTRLALAEGADAGAAVEALETVRSIVDVTIYVWNPEREVWRKLTFGEMQALWDNRDAEAGQHA